MVWWFDMVSLIKGHVSLSRWRIMSHVHSLEVIRLPFVLEYEIWIGDFIWCAYTGAYSSQMMMDLWVIAILQRRSGILFTLEYEMCLAYFIWCTLHKGILLLDWWWILSHSHSFRDDEIFLSHWSTSWVIFFDVTTLEHRLLIGIDWFLRWFD